MTEIESGVTRTLPYTPTHVTSLSFSRDSTLLLVGLESGEVILVDTKTGSRLGAVPPVSSGPESPEIQKARVPCQ
eukprot:CAMPEP_0185790352 /NCGR_PEP_ID=MMETSP1174-20130828/155707_1 /TAXON_ID=35687 /ORGANISM="Dictyocha speculum, Strain CCMP1381" /LENGTH=74 /DNA_ID=CAMNT_0028484977 /DNA_START=87 /DNA_END=308 /DNA_ORIENTATION=+